MSLIDKIKSRPENSAKAPAPKPDVEILKAEVEALNKDLDLEAKTKAEEHSEENLTPEQLEARTTSSYEDEIKKLREENAKRRKKEQDAKESALAMADEVFKIEREEYESQLAEMKKQLLEIKSLKKEENKVEEEIKATQSRVELDMLKKELKALQAESSAARAEIEAQKKRDEDERSLRRQAAENRFKAMITEIPEEFKEAASAMFKGYTDPSEGLIAITKYKAQGLFGKKTIEVVNRIPREDNNNKTNTVPTSREKFAKRTEALKNRRQGLVPGQTL